ncbi:hypothetical protein LTR27_008720 [Elasticomyces elasticus]|nr:hypothetical protein LTR27_008720 [Elasticomyces elasticus]
MARMLDALEAMVPDAVWMETTSVGSSRTESVISAVSEVPPLLAKYLDFKGDEGVYRTRLQDLEDHYNEGLAQREFFTERGDTLEVSDDQYNDEYRTRREFILTNLGLAEKQAMEAEARCHAAGININIAPLSENATAASGSMMRDIALTSDAVAMEGDSITPPQSGIGGDLDTSGIHRWLERLTGEEPDVTDPML